MDRATDATLPAFEADEAPAPGEIISGKYRVERVVGAGGMAIVVEATHLELEERVALKFLNRAARRSSDLVGRFAKEARATAKLKSEHVAKVFDVGTREDGSPFIVMEYLEGHDLAAEVAKVGSLAIQDAVEYVIHACEALSEAHYRGIVHRDIKPENLFLVARPSGRFVKVLDFGISKIALTGRTSTVDLQETGTQRIMGSPYYMSPEQLRSSRAVDWRTDIWSLGAVLFELLTGVRAFPDADDFSSLVITIVQERHRSLLDYMKSVDTGLIEIVDRCLEKDREKRFTTAAELALALLPYARVRARATAERAVAFAESTATGQRLQVPTSVRPARSPRRSRERNATSVSASVTGASDATKPERGRNLRLAMVIGAAAIVGGVAVRLLTSDRPAPATAAPAASSAAAAAAVAPSPPQETARLTVSATPHDARIFIDGAETPTNPFVAVLRRDGITHFVRVEAPGRETKTRTFVATGDSTIDVALAETPAAPARGAPAPAAANAKPAPRAAAPAAPPAAAAAPKPEPPAPQESATPPKHAGQSIDGTSPY